MKDWLLRKGVETALSVLVRDYGTLKRVSLNSVERWCEAELELKGETEAVMVRIEGVTFRTGTEHMFVQASQIQCSREWLTRLGHKYLVGREFALPAQAAAAIRLLL